MRSRRYPVQIEPVCITHSYSRKKSIMINEIEKKELATAALALIEAVKAAGKFDDTFKSFVTNCSFPLRYPTPKFTERQLGWWKYNLSCNGIEVPSWIYRELGVEETDDLVSFLKKVEGAK